MDSIGKAHIKSSNFHDCVALTCKDDTKYILFWETKFLTKETDQLSNLTGSVYHRIVLLGALELETAVARRGTVWTEDGSALSSVRSKSFVASGGWHNITAPGNSTYVDRWGRLYVTQATFLQLNCSTELCPLVLHAAGPRVF